MQFRKYLIGLIICVVVAVGVYFVWRRLANTGSTTSRQNVQQTRELKVEQARQNTAALIEKSYQTDKDLDGLSDTEEAKLGTDPNNPDSDSDGLFDKSEVTVFKTNPLKSDTYGIGHTDSWGVMNRVILPGGKFVK